MTFVIDGSDNAHFRQDIMQKRYHFIEKDAVLASDLLKFYLKYYEKCIENFDQPLRSKRQTLNILIKNCRLNRVKGHGIERMG